MGVFFKNFCVRSFYSATFISTFLSNSTLLLAALPTRELLSEEGFVSP